MDECPWTTFLPTVAAGRGSESCRTRARPRIRNWYLKLVWGELVWSHLKRSLANLAKRNLAQLTALVKTRLRRMQYRPGLLDGFLASTGLDLAFP